MVTQLIEIIDDRTNNGHAAQISESLLSITNWVLNDGATKTLEWLLFTTTDQIALHKCKSANDVFPPRDRIIVHS